MKKDEGVMAGLGKRSRAKMEECNSALMKRFASLRARIADEKGQGTTEYAILVGI